MTQENPLERYTILRELGRGAIGTVYAARDLSTGVIVALKVLDPALFSEPNATLAQRFLENARSAARLRHRNIVRILEAGEAPRTAFVAMELVEGESLRRMLDDRPLSIARAIQVFDDVASALAYAHEEGMVHRGVKPSNIIVMPSGVAKIGDFGLGQIGEAALRYMSPEQVRRAPIDHRSDLFSLGTVFYEMLTRRAPFEGTSPDQIRESILRTEPPPPRKVNPHVPVALDAIVLRMLAVQPDARFSNGRMLLRELQRLEETLGLGPGAGSGAGAPTTASVPPASAPEPMLRTPGVNRPRDPAPMPMQEAPRFERSDEPRIPAGVALQRRDARLIKDREARPESSSGSRAAFLAALALILAMLSLGLTVLLYYSPDFVEELASASGIKKEKAPAKAAAPPPSTAAAPPSSTAPPPLTEAINEPATPPAAAEASPPPAAGDGRPEESSAWASGPSLFPPQPLVEEPGPSAEAETSQPQELEQAATGETAPTQQAPPARRPRAKVAESQPGAMAKLVIAVSPQGELYIDGEHYGTTPPITTLELAPGMHQVEVRSGSRKPYVTYMTVKPGEERHIRHDFNAKPSRPPG